MFQWKIVGLCVSPEHVHDHYYSIHTCCHGDPVWYSPASLSAVMEILATHDNVKLITGDTGRGDYTVIVVVLDHCSLLSYRCVQGT